jgi:hypothetical protein
MDSSAMAQARNRRMRAGKPEPRAIPSRPRCAAYAAVALAWILAIVLLHGLSSSLPNVTID